MGLDDVELVLEIEHAFGIRFENDDEELARVRTVADLAALVSRRVGPVDRTACETRSCFREIRDALSRATGRSRSDIRPRTPLAKILPEADRSRLWRDVERAAGVPFPSLDPPPGVGRLSRCFRRATAASAVAVILVSVVLVRDPIVLLVIPSAIGLTWLLDGAWNFATRPLARHFPPGIETVRDLVHATFQSWRRRSGQEGPPIEGVAPARVLSTIRRLAAEQMDIDPALVRPETRFADLGF